MLFAQDVMNDVIDVGDGYLAITVHVGSSHVAIAQNHIIDSVHISNIDMSVTIHVTRQFAEIDDSNDIGVTTGVARTRCIGNPITHIVGTHIIESMIHLILVELQDNIFKFRIRCYLPYAIGHSIGGISHEYNVNWGTTYQTAIG